MKTFDIPGGTASFREKDELTVGGSRAIALATRKLPRKTLEEAEKQAKAIEDGADTEPVSDAEPAETEETDILGFPIDLSDDDVDAAWGYNDTLVIAYLAGWSLDRPLPKNRDDLDELPAPLYSALSKAISAHTNPPKKGADVDGFSVDAVEDADSPTGA